MAEKLTKRQNRLCMIIKSMEKEVVDLTDIYNLCHKDEWRLTENNLIYLMVVIEDKGYVKLITDFDKQEKKLDKHLADYDNIEFETEDDIDKHSSKLDPLLKINFMITSKLRNLP
jgi:hypothetical protein